MPMPDPSTPGFGWRDAPDENRRETMERSAPATCTVELTTGSFIHLNHEPGLVLDQRARHVAYGSEPSSPLYCFERVTNASVTRWEQVWLDVTQIVAVYPVHTRPEPSQVHSQLTVGGLLPQGG